MASKKKKKNSAIWKFCIIFFALGAIVMFMTDSIFGGLTYLLLLIVSICAHKTSKTKEPPVNSQKKSSQKVASKPTKRASEVEIDSIGRALENSIPNVPLQPTPIHIEEPTVSNNITEKHHVTGISHYMDNLMQLADENDIYNYSKRELIDNAWEEQRIYQYDFYIDKAELIEEPANPYDPNAIKVVLDGMHVGYIKKGSCAHIKKLIASDRIISISAKVGGGKYKYLSCEYDYEKDKDVYELERDERNYFIDIILELKETK